MTKKANTSQEVSIVGKDLRNAYDRVVDKLQEKIASEQEISEQGIEKIAAALSGLLEEVLSYDANEVYEQGQLLMKLADYIASQDGPRNSKTASEDDIVTSLREYGQELTKLAEDLAETQLEIITEMLKEAQGSTQMMPQMYGMNPETMMLMSLLNEQPQKQKLDLKTLAGLGLGATGLGLGAWGLTKNKGLIDTLRKSKSFGEAQRHIGK